MCRYGFPKTYKYTYVCFVCQIGFKSRGAKECHSCKGAVHNVGRDYRVPRKGSPQWRVLGRMISDGQNFHTCGCSGIGPVAKTIGAYKRLTRKP